MPGVEAVRQQIQNWWQSLAQWQQIAAIGLGIGSLALLLYLTAMAQAPEYAVAYSGLSEQDAAAVVEALKKNNTPYQLDDGGSTIRVPARQVYEVRLALARQGLPKEGTVGFEIFDSGQLGNLGMTDFMQRVNYQRALEGELARTIGSLDPVQAARVHLAIPEPSLFLDEEKKPSASVLVYLKPGRHLDRGQIEAITHLVASSVEDLTPSRIAIVDAEGNVLWSGEDDSRGLSSEQVSATYIELQRKYEAETQNRLQNLLDKTLGPGKAAVQVSATMDWDRLETSSETYTQGGPGGGVLRSSQVVEEYQGRPDAAAGGIPGMDSNSSQVPFYPSVITDTTKEGGYVRREAIYNYEVSKTVQNLVKAPGSVKRLSVAVLLDKSIPTDQQQNIKQLVSAAVGLDPARGDTIVVTTADFDRSSYAQQEKALQSAQRYALIITGVKALASIVGLVLLLLFVRGLFYDLAYRRLYPRMAVVPVAQQSLTAETVRGQLPPGGSTSALGAGVERPAVAARVGEEIEDELEISALSRPQAEEVRYLQHIAALAREDPDIVADIIERWLREE
ncbi:MAG: flagellar M-ring protein FliF [Anaerolineae bacterium]|nr:flagellar M-ring protein FliF [Anaerolineae bacterium]